jgi:hypothetical protein
MKEIDISEESKKNEEKIKELTKTREQKGKGQNNEIMNVKEQKDEDIENIENNEYKGLDDKEQLGEDNQMENIKESNEENRTSEINNGNQNNLPKSLLSKKTEDNYNLMSQYFKKDNNKRSGENIIDIILNYEDYSNDKYLVLANDKYNDINKNKIDDFLKRNAVDIISRQENNKNIKNRIKLIHDSTNKKIYFNNKQSEKEYFDSFYNKQIEFKKNCKEHLNQLNKKINEEINKTCLPEPKKPKNLNYFKNKEPIEISKYSFKSHQQSKINQNNNNDIVKENNNEINKIVTLRKNNLSVSQNRTSNTNDNTQNNSNIASKNMDEKNRKLQKIKSYNNIMNKNRKLTKQDVRNLTNKLHYDGELIKIKKQIKIAQNIENIDKKNDFSREKISHSSIIILIKKLLFEYSSSIKKNVFVNYKENPKLNYEQYIDILKDLYYLEKDSLPEDYLDEDTMYKELWNKLIQFSSGPENSIESNVFLLYLLELNGYFSNESIIKELKNEIYWIKLEEYDDLIANAKYIEENWDDLKNVKINYIKKLKLEGKYKSKHSQELFNNYIMNNKKKLKTNIDTSTVNDNNHYITTLKGNTNYHIIHGYNSKNKKNENNNSFEFTNSFSVSNLSNKIIKNRINIRDSYNDLIIKRKNEIENRKKTEEIKLKEICTFKPKIKNINKKIFTNNVKVELPKYKRNRSAKIYNINPSASNNNLRNHSNKDNNENSLTKTNHNMHYISKTNNNTIVNDNKNNELTKKKSSLKKMFENNPLKNDKNLNEKIQRIKMNKFNESENILHPMRFDIEYPSKFENMGITINKEANRQSKHNVIFYNIKINEEMKTLKFIEGDDLELNVIKFVCKNKYPIEVTNIILKKIKEKIFEEINYNLH